MDLLKKFPPLKCKYLRANHSKFMIKELIKAIMLRTRFRLQFLKMKISEAGTNYNKQKKHFCQFYIATSINRCIAEGTFLNAFKKAEVRPIFKKDA